MGSADVSAEGYECIISVEGWEKLQAVKILKGNFITVMFMTVRFVRMTFVVPENVKNKYSR